jgi:hypothetical protein
MVMNRPSDAGFRRLARDTFVVAKPEHASRSVL